MALAADQESDESLDRFSPEEQLTVHLDPWTVVAIGHHSEFLSQVKRDSFLRSFRFYSYLGHDLLEAGQMLHEDIDHFSSKSLNEFFSAHGLRKEALRNEMLGISSRVDYGLVYKIVLPPEDTLVRRARTST